MKTDLLFAYQDDLKKESKRIFDILFEKYKNNEKINMSFDDAIKKYQKKEYSYYSVEIMFGVYSFIPEGVRPDPNNVEVLVSDKEATLRHIISYANFCLKEKSYNKNPKKASKVFVKMLIKLYKNKELNNVGLLEVLSRSMPILYPDHNDSMDAKALVLYLQDDLEKLGYIVDDINPIKLRRV